MWTRLRLIAAISILCMQQAAGQTVICPPNIDFNFNNFSGWSCYTGTSQSTAPSGTLPAFANPMLTAPVSGPPSRHLITSGLGTDFYGGFPVVAPGGFRCLKLGNSNAGSGAERVRYFVHVPAGANDYALNFKYAVVLNDSSHAAYSRPAFTVIGYDSATGNPLPCATHVYAVNNPASPGFLASAAAPNVYYLPWSDGIFNLSGQAGKTITVEVTSYDCADGGHFGYGYFDIISCGRFQPSPSYCDLDNGLIILAAPTGYASYKWYKGPVIGALHSSSSLPTTTVPLPAVPTFYYCVLMPFGNSSCADTIRTRTISDFSMNALPDFVCNQRIDPVIQLDLVASPPSGDYSYSWEVNPGLSCNNCKNPFVIPFAPIFFIGIVADSIGCFRKDTVREAHSNIKLSLGRDTTICLGILFTLKPALTPLLASYVFSWKGANAAA